MHAASFFVPSFLRALKDNTEESFRSIITEPSPGIYVFEMLQSRACAMLLSEVCFHLSRHYVALCFQLEFSSCVVLSGSDCLGREL